MDLQTLVAVFSLFAINMALPGPNAVVIAQARVTGDVDSAIAGIAVGQFCWAIASLFGVAALITRTPDLISFIQLTGAVWFFVAGFRTLYPRGAREAVDVVTRRDVPAGGGLSTGLASSLLNPGTAVLFIAALPALLVGSTPGALQIVAISIVYAGMSVVTSSLVSRAVGLGERKVSSPRARSVLAPVPGLALMSFGFLFAATA